MLELYHEWDSFCSMKVRLCLAEKQVAWQDRRVDLLRFEHLRPDYLKLNPNAVVPTLVHDGTPIIESSAINEYLDEVFAEPPLKPADPVGRAHMRAWVTYEDDVLHQAVIPGTYNLMIKYKLQKMTPKELEALLDLHPHQERREHWRMAALRPIDEAEVAKSRTQLGTALGRMDQTLSEGRWLAGETFSLADVAVAPLIDRLERLRFSDLLAERKQVRDWIARMKARPSYVQMLPPESFRLPAARTSVSA